jgi:hypothetical protein
MLTEHAARLIASVAALDRAVEDAGAAAKALECASPTTEAAPWLPGICQSLTRIQLECVDLRFAAHAVRDALPSATTLQPRLL